MDTFVVLVSAILWTCVGGTEIGVTSKQLSYLQEYGYLNFASAELGALEAGESVKKAVQRFQEYSGIPGTGKIDDATLRQFNQPRCGVKDIVPGEESIRRKRKKRFTIKGLKWHTRTLTYRVESWTDDLSRVDVLRTVRETLHKWQRVSRLRFRFKAEGNADIMIKFVKKEHNDQYAFDGPGGTLAHAFFPGRHTLAGDTHFDDDELFTLKTYKGKNLYWVALHEFGHALGLDHTNVKGTVMYPFYQGYQGKNTDLQEDDIKGIQYLYGKPSNYRRPKVVTQDKPKINTRLDKSSKCLTRVDSITIPRGSGNVVVINGDKLYIYDSESMKRRKGPISLVEYYPGGLTNVDASYSLPNGNSVYLQEQSSWEYIGRKAHRKDVSLLRRGMPDQIYNVDAAFYWSKARKVYIFKGAYYWRYNPFNRQVDSGYPKKIKDSWVGIPDNIDSVFELKKNIYFFKGDQYYRFHTKRYEVVRGYPRPIYEFFRCPVVQTQRSSRVLALQRQQQRRGQDEKQSVLVAASSSTKKFHNGGLLILPSLLLMFIRCF